MQMSCVYGDELSAYLRALMWLSDWLTVIGDTSVTL